MTKIIVDDLGRIPMSPYLVATLSRAAAYADAQSHLQVTIEHLLLALAEDPEATVVLKSSDIDIARLSADISAHLGRIEERQVEGGPRQVAISSDLKRILEAAAAAASQSRRREINGAIVLAAVVGEGRSTAAHVLRSQGMTFEQAIKALKDVQTAPVRRAPASAEEILADARERVQSRTQPPQREPAPVVVQPAAQPAPPSSGLAVPLDQVGGGGSQTPSMLDSLRYQQAGSASTSAAGDPTASRIPIEPTWESVQPAETRDVAPAPPSAPQPAPPRPDYGPRPELSAPTQPSPYEAPTAAQQPMAPAPSFPPAPAPAASQPPPPAPMQPAPPPQWAPPAQQPAAGAPTPRQPQRMPPPIPVVPSGPLPFPGASSPAGGGPTLPMPSAPPPQQGYRTPAPPPWTDGQSPDPRAQQVARPRGTAASDAMADPHARADRPMQPQAPSQPQTQPPTRGGADPRRRAVAPTIQAGQLVETIPRKMRVGQPVMVEARVARAEVKAIAEGMQSGGAIYRHEIMVSKAMTVRLRSPDGGFTIETASPETQWIDNVLGVMADDFASWRWTVTARQRGRRRLQLIVSARTVGGDGLMAETALPDQVVEVKVGINYPRSAVRWAGWAAAAIVGGVLARFGENAYVVARSFVDRMGG